MRVSQMVKGARPCQSRAPGPPHRAMGPYFKSTPEGQLGRLYQFLNRALSNPYNGSLNLGS